MDTLTHATLAAPALASEAQSPLPGKQRLLPLYTIAEVAKLTGMSAYWLREQCREGRIAHHRLGRSYRLSHEDVLALLATTRVAPQQGGLTPTRHQRR